MSVIKPDGANERGVGTKQNPRRANDGTRMRIKGRWGKMGGGGRDTRDDAERVEIYIVSFVSKTPISS